MKEQNYSNHVRWNPLVHFVITPLLTAYFAWSIYRLTQNVSTENVIAMLFAFTIILVSITARTQALVVQSRVIRLEEQIRYKELLSGELLAKALKLPSSKIIALRFASDEELPTLIERVIKGELTTQKEIKMSVKNWRADHFRA